MSQVMQNANTGPRRIARLNEMEFKAFARTCAITMHYAPTSITLFDSVLVANIPDKRARIVADMSGLIKPKIYMTFSASNKIVKALRTVSGEGDVDILLDAANAGYLIRGPHTDVPLMAANVAQEVLSCPAIHWVGVPQNTYPPKHLKQYIGKHQHEVQLAVYANQLEQLAVPGAHPYTFKAGMSGQLQGCQPQAVLLSTVAFSFFKEKQEIQLGTVLGNYVLAVTNTIDVNVNLVVYEQVELVK